MDQTPTNSNDSTDQAEGTPIDAIIARVDSYARDPKLVTPETLMELKAELEDLKTVVDQEEPTAQPEGEGGVSVLMKGMKK